MPWGVEDFRNPAWTVEQITTSSAQPPPARGKSCCSQATRSKEHCQIEMGR